MTVRNTDVLRAARLAQLRVPADEMEGFTSRLLNVFKWINQLQQVEVKGYEPLVNPMDDWRETTPMRKDEVHDGECAEKILQNAPSAAHDMFVVPKVVE
jgi:aspartyl-tRNA(Asn)/glutamyl-tRNA(Gln) amidotransferase subunit C